MSKNRTIISGMDFNPADDTSAADQGSVFYRPSAKNVQKTIIAGSVAADNGDNLIKTPISGEDSMSDENAEERLVVLQQRVMVGILFSLSRTLLGEIFPIYLGRNLVGTSPSCDIRLYEATVSAEHAVIYVRKFGFPDQYEVTVSDYGSAYGTAVDDKDGRFETLKMTDQSVLSLGNHYRFLIKIFNPETRKLFEDSDFQAIPHVSSHLGKDTEEAYETNVSSDFYSPSKKKETSDKTVIS